MKLFILSLIFLFPFTLNAEVSDTVKLNQDDMSDIRKVLDMKIFHDSFFVEKMIEGLYEQEMAGVYSNPSVMQEIGHENLFNNRDAALVRQEIAGRVMRTKLIQTPWEEHKKAIQEDPFEALMGVIEDQEILKLKQVEVDDLNSVDKNVIPQTIQMLTESGPDIGASPVSVIYNENVDLQ